MKFHNRFVTLVINHHRILGLMQIRFVFAAFLSNLRRIEIGTSPTALDYWRWLLSLMSLSTSQNEFTIVDVSYGSISTYLLGIKLFKNQHFWSTWVINFSSEEALDSHFHLDHIFSRIWRHYLSTGKSVEDLLLFTKQSINQPMLIVNCRCYKLQCLWALNTPRIHSIW